MKNKRYSKKNYSRRRVALLKRNMFLGMMMFVMVVVVTCAFVVTSNAKEDHAMYKYYTSIEIQDGDSLWAIAEKYGSHYSNKETYISEVKKINHIQGEKIHSGEYLTIPYYSAEIK